MQSTETRFWLRFESGDREGNRVPLPEGGASIGRLEDNDIVVAHSSVSGHHARFEVENGHVRLVDLGSTNGLKVEGQKIDSQLLAHGDRILLGRVGLVFEDLHVKGGAGDAAPVPLAGAGAGSPAALGSELGSVRQEVVERAGAGSGSSATRLAFLALLLIGALAFTAWRFDLLGLFTSGAEGDLAAQVPEVPGNVLANPSFEDPDALGWESAEAGTLSFRAASSYAHAGRSGLGAPLAAGEWALARSPDFALPQRRALELRAWLEASGSARGRVGLELIGGGGEDSGPSFIAWAPALDSTGSAGFKEIVLSFETLPGYARGRVVVAGLAEGAEGAVALDDVSVVRVDDAGDHPSADFQEYQLRVLGSPGSTAVLMRSGRVLFSSIALSSWTANGLEGWASAGWDVRASENGFELVALSGSGTSGASAPPGTRCVALPFGRRPLEREDASEHSVVTVGPGGYRRHALPFERAEASELLAGDGVNLIGFAFDRPVRVAASVPPTGPRLVLDFSGRSSLRMQLDFRSERAEAIALAARARQTEEDGPPGEAIRLWTELIDHHPYEARLVDEAEERRSNLEQLGLSRVERISEALERARFFQLSDLFRSTLDDALAAARDFAGSDTEGECLALAQEIRAQLVALGESGTSGREARLAGVLSALPEAQFPRLRAHVRAALEDRGEEN